jgi:hypothetical protein
MWTLALAVALAVTGPLAAAPFVPDGSLDLGRPGNDPVAAGSAVQTGAEQYTISAGGSDWWDGGEYGHFAYRSITGDFWIESDVTWVNRTGAWTDMNEWVKAGVAIRNDIDTGSGNEKEVNFLLANLRPDREAASFQYRLVNTNNMADYSAWGIGVQDTRRVALNRWTDADGDTLVQGFYSNNGGVDWVLVSQQWAYNLNDTAYVGLAVTAHENDGRLESAVFDTPQILAAVTPTGALPRKAGGFVNDPEGVHGVMGGWGVLEVVNAGSMNSVGEAISKIESGVGTRHTYNLMGGINIKDGAGDAKNFKGDGNYGVADAGIKTEGSVDEIAFLARGQILIPESGEWTFYINSDDGEELSINNNRLQTTGSEGWNDNNFVTVNLAAGVHNIQVIHREAGGGADVEVAAAKGNTRNLYEFSLIGSGAAAKPAMPAGKPGFLSDVTVEYFAPGAYGVGNIATTEASIAAARSAGALITTTASVINHRDPENGGEGSIGGDSNFWWNTGGDDNNIGLLVTGTLEIPFDGTWFFGFQGDDGSRLTIPGQTFTAIVEAEDWGASQISGDGQSILRDNGTGNSRTVGSINLLAGAYPFEFLYWEGGGGAYVELFGGSIQGQYALLTTGGASMYMLPAVAPALDLVPEPATLALLGFGALALVRRRK